MIGGVTTDLDHQAWPQSNPRVSLLTATAVGAGTLATCGLIAAAVSVKVAALLVGAALLPVAVIQPWVTLALFTGTEVSQAAVVAKAHGYPSPVLLLQVLSVGCILWAANKRRLIVAWSPVMTAALLYLGAQAATILVAPDPALARRTTVQTGRDLITLFVVAILLVTTKRYWGLTKVCVAVLAGLALLTIVQQFVLHNHTDFGGLSQIENNLDIGAATIRHEGPIGDPNFWGRVLVAFVPFGAAAAMLDGRRRLRLAWAGAFASLLIGVYLTQSRGALLALGAAIVAFATLAGWKLSRWLVLAPLAIAVLLALPFTGPRLRTLVQLQGSTKGVGDESLVLRSASLKIGERMFEDHPLLGIGAGNYNDESILYAQRIDVPGVGDQLTGGIAPHNAFLEKAAEGGTIGLLAFLYLIGAMFYCAFRAWIGASRRAGPSAPTPELLLCAAALTSILAWTVASVFLHVEQFRTLLVIGGIIAALDIRARELAVPPGPGIRPRWRRQQRVHVLALLTLTVSLAVILQSAAIQHSWQANVTTVATTSSNLPSGYIRGFQFDLLSAGSLLPTFARVMTVQPVVAAAKQAGQRATPGASVSVTAIPSALAGLIVISARGPTPASVRAAATSAAVNGVREANQLNISYRISAINPTAPTLTPRSRLRPIIGASLIGLALLLVFAYVAWILHRRHDALVFPS